MKTTKAPKKKKTTGRRVINIDDLLRIQTFANKKGVERQAIYYHINVLGSIKPLVIDGVAFISWAAYKDHEFRSANSDIIN